MATTTNLTNLIINYLSQAQYDAAVANGTIDENQLYFTPPTEITSDQARKIYVGTAAASSMESTLANGDIYIQMETSGGGDTSSVIPRTTFTPTSGSSYTSWGGCWYERQGKICRVHIGVSGLTPNSLTTIYQVPDSITPARVAVAMGVGYSNNINDICRGYVWPDKNVQVLATSDFAQIDIIYFLD